LVPSKCNRELKLLCVVDAEADGFAVGGEGVDLV
jgi:hypothetical protein